MEMNGSAIRNQAALLPAHVWETAKGWAKAYLTKETMLDAALMLATIGSAGFVLFSLHKIVLNWTVTGF